MSAIKKVSGNSLRVQNFSESGAGDVNPALFRPSAMLRRRNCPGSLALESSVKQIDDEDDGVRAEGSMLHKLAANPSLPRDGLNPQQLDLLEAVERAEKEFLETILKK